MSPGDFSVDKDERKGRSGRHAAVDHAASKSERFADALESTPQPPGRRPGAVDAIPRATRLLLVAE